MFCTCTSAAKVVLTQEAIMAEAMVAVVDTAAEVHLIYALEEMI
jgi:hypothetical protein